MSARAKSIDFMSQIWATLVCVQNTYMHTFRVHVVALVGGAKFQHIMPNSVLNSLNSVLKSLPKAIFCMLNKKSCSYAVAHCNVRTMPTLSHRYIQMYALKIS